MGEETERFPDISYEAPVLDIPPPSDDLPYSLLEDYRQREILKANGIALTGESLAAVLTSGDYLLQAAAAHTIGSDAIRAALPALKQRLATADDLVRVEIAYALARLGDQDGHTALVHALASPPEGYLAPPIAAGYLAQRGDPQGFPVIERCFASALAATKMLACKQFFFFVPFHGTRDPSGREIDVVALFDRALSDPDSDIQWQALVQLRQLDVGLFGPILERYRQSAVDDHLRTVASGILSAHRSTS